MKKGFTLVELLGVIVILGVISLITFPIIDKSIKNGKEKSLEQVIHNIEKAAYEYSIKNELLYSTVYNKIELSTLISSGFLKENIINPVTNEPMKGCVLYKWVEDYNQFEFKYDEECIIKTIEDVVLEKFPYLKTDGNGCVMSTNDNYSYMGGCYLKGSSLSGKDIFYEKMELIGLNNETITKNFFDNEGNFIAENFENWAMSKFGITEQDLVDMGVDTAFEGLSTSLFGSKIKSEELFAREALANSLWYSGFLWRIMGINSDGTVKLITDENITSIPYQVNNSNWNDSYIKEWLNDYFYNKLDGNDIIKEQVWCSEITEDRESRRTTCTNNLSNGLSKVGLITLDEYNLSGGLTSYLNISQYHWTMTPHTLNSYSWYVTYDGVSGPSGVSFSFGVRAVINVNSQTVITGGNGTLDENWNNEEGPYILNEYKNIEVIGKLNEKATSGEYVMFAGKKYRVIDKDNKGNTKLILDGCYEETAGTSYEVKYGENNIFTTSSGIGQKLNSDVLNWIVSNDDVVNRNKLVENYTWYQNDFYYGDSYKISLEEINSTRSISATVGLIRIGEILSNRSSSMLTNGYTKTSNYKNAIPYWTMTPDKSDSKYAWIIAADGSAGGAVFAFSIRPVIVIKSDVDIISGSGTWSNPYEI